MRIVLGMSEFTSFGEVFAPILRFDMTFYDFAAILVQNREVNTLAAMILAFSGMLVAHLGLG